MERDAAARVLQKSLHVLASTLDPVPLATALYSAEVIEERTWEEARAEGASYDRNLKVIGAVRRSIKAKPEYFDKFCSILEEQAVTKDLAKKLKGKKIMEARYCTLLAITAMLLVYHRSSSSLASQTTFHKVPGSRD